MQDTDRYQKIVEIASEAIISIDSDYKIVLFNEGAENVFGYKPKEVLGKPLDLLMPIRFHAAHRNHVDNFKTGKASSRKMNERRKIFGLRKSGEEFPAIASILKTGKGNDTNFTVILRDISTIEKIRRELHRRIDELETDNIDLKKERQKLDNTESLLEELLRQSNSF